MHVIEAANDEDAAAMFKSIGEKPGDLSIWIKRYSESETPLPARHVYSVDASVSYRGERIVLSGADADL